VKLESQKKGSRLFTRARTCISYQRVCPKG